MSVTSRSRRRAARRRGRQYRVVVAAHREIGAGAAGVAALAEEVEQYRRLVRRHAGQGLLRSRRTAMARIAPQAAAVVRHPGAGGAERQGAIRAKPERSAGLVMDRSGGAAVEAVERVGEVEPRYREFVRRQVLEEREAAYLTRIGLRAWTPLELWSVLRVMPSLGRQLDIGRITSRLNEAYPREAATARAAHVRAVAAAKRRRYGAGKSGAGGGSEGGGGGGWADELDPGAKLVEGEDVMVSGIGTGWEVRQQGDRGTCVAFACVACLERAYAAQGEDLRLSEQYLYWALKRPKFDAFVGVDASRLLEVPLALQALGVCTEAHWEYWPQVIPKNICHTDHPVKPSPDEPALQDGRKRRGARPGVHTTGEGERGAAQRVYDMLATGRPVAVSLAVLSADGDVNNWDNAMTNTFGVVTDPPSNPEPGDEWQEAGGHAVCIVGYRGNPDSLGQGAFILRNSWSKDWGRDLPDPDGTALGPEAGYGQVSAAYVERYLWEAWQP